MGQVVRVLADRVIIAPDPAPTAAPLKAGDGVVFDAAGWRSPEEHEEGGRIYHVTQLRDGQLELRFGNGAINTARIKPGDLLWRTHDPDLDKVARPFTQATTPVHKQPVNLRVTAHEGAAAGNWNGRWPSIRKCASLCALMSRFVRRRISAIDAAYLREQLGRLGNTPYELADIELDMHGRPFAPSLAAQRLAPPGGRAIDRAAKPRRCYRSSNDPLATLEDEL